ncbi:hypothetical protein APE_2249.1 [Aeropyrum pernix K1]|uniref:Uncharacterized protein n=1 Tax=Aeropyrum pernix (strain ATCC 700893 / DSM 11879 / JCM 9820 / NBRC 100138 / K1) TaxID=272557 RepID=Q9Y9N9_AERPE|nr:hypothetical protein [Aeropyrum pernix]BAA81261.2 hypothetical protein APE_2249.1 [Aeropyrum pernix K1]
MSRYNVRVRTFQKSYIRIGPALLGVLQLERSESFTEEGDPLDTLSYVIESRSKASDYVEVEIEFIARSRSHETLPDKMVRGEYGVAKRFQARPLFPRPARLLRLGVVRLERIMDSMREHGGYASLRGEDIEWYTPPGNVYVLEGEAEVQEDVAYLVLETEHGSRWLRTLTSLVLKPPSLQHDRQA